MTDQQLQQLQQFADEIGFEFETPTVFDRIWNYVVGFLASLGFIFTVFALGLWWAGAFK